MLDRKGQIKRLRELRDMLEGAIPMDGRKKEIKEDIHDLEYWLGITKEPYTPAMPRLRGLHEAWE
jgi:hypothetical protein